MCSKGVYFFLCRHLPMCIHNVIVYAKRIQVLVIHLYFLENLRVFEIHRTGS